MEESSSPASRRGAISEKRTGWRKVRYILYSLLALLGAWMFLMLIMVGAAGWYTSRPQFCNSCHIMEPYYKSWQVSSHKDVTCVECHFPPGVGGKVRGKLLGLVQLIKYVTASAGPRPTAEIPDASCLRSGCHETRLLSGKVDFHGIPFDHTPHLQEERRGKKLQCTSCHSQIVQGSHMTVTTTTCFLCHFKDQPFNAQLSACTHCHQIPDKTFDLGGGVKFTHEEVFKRGVRNLEKPAEMCALCHSDLIRGNGNVPQERCLSCHSREGDLAKYNDQKFMHQKHVTEHKVDCIQCHTPIEHSLHLATVDKVTEDIHGGLRHVLVQSKQPEKVEQAVNDCQSCHPNHHQQQVNLLRGVGAKTVGVEPNMMLAIGAECRTCHGVQAVTPNGSTIVRGSLQRCEACHDAARVQKFETYHAALRGALPGLVKTLDDIQAASAKGGLPAGRADAIAAEAGNLRHDLLMLQWGNDVHNMHFAAKLVKQALDRAAELCQELHLPPPNVPLPPLDGADANPKR